MAFKVGDRVECWTKDEGFLDSYYVANLQSTSGKRCIVKYVELLTEDGDRLIENLPLEQLRPLPPNIDPPGEDPNFLPGSYIEAYHQDGWWKGAIHKKVDKDCYLCYFLSNGIEQLQFHYRELRTCQDWVDGAWIVKGAKGALTPAPPAPQKIVHLKLPSPRTPESPSPRDPSQGKNNPRAESAASEGFVLDDDEEEDVDIETSWGGPVLAAGGEGIGATPQLPSDEEGTVSDRGGSPSGEEVDRLPGGGAASEPIPTREKPGKKNGTKSGSGEIDGEITPGQIGTMSPGKRKGSGREREGSPSSKKPRKAPAPAKGKGGAGEKKNLGKSVSKKKHRQTNAAADGQAHSSRESEPLALVQYVDLSETSRDSCRHKGSNDQQGQDWIRKTSEDPQRQNHSESRASGFGQSPFGKNVVLRWGSKQRSMHDIMRRSSVDSAERNADPYERECEIDRERRKAHKKPQTQAQTRHLAATSACQLVRQQDWHVAPVEHCHLAPQQESNFTPYQESWGAQESTQGDGWAEWHDERPCLPMEPLWGGHGNGCGSRPAQLEAPLERFSFRAAYGGILEALLRKDMPGFRREYLLAELRSELRISDRCHEKQYQHALRRISGLAE